MIHQLRIGILGSNCYLVVDDASKEAAVVDPGFDDATAMRRVIQSEGVHVAYVLNTHGHFDHVAGNGALESPDRVLGIHPDDRELLLTGGGAVQFGFHTPLSPDPDLDLVDDLRLSLGDTHLTVLHTPGHTRGSICLYVEEEQALLTGDTLFRGGVGRTDLPGGSTRTLARSLTRIARLPDATRIYPGHGDATILGREKATNPWLKNLPLMR